MDMFRKYMLVVVCLLGAGVVQAQNLSQARALLKEGKYAEALPAFQRYVKQSPANANYNYWYGACCVETGQARESLPYLEKAAKRKVLEAYPYLIRAQLEQYLFDEAVESGETYVELLAAKKKPVEKADSILAKARMASLMLRGTERICIVDSFAVNKQDFLSVYRLGPETGLVDTYNNYFQTEGQPGTVYQNELGQKLYLAQRQGDRLEIFTSDKLMDKWSRPVPVKGLDADGNNCCPFVMSDGVTFYYANDGSNSLGGYDIFVTRFNGETGQFLKPENIGMPYNSMANDYMLAMDEFNQLGWFASDRYQPQDSVCVYVFVPNDSRETYDMEKDEPAAVRRAARIQSIRDSWTDEARLRAARQRLTVLAYQRPQEVLKRDFVFVVDDKVDYYVLSDFQSPEARKLFRQWQQMCSDFQKLKNQLEQLRMEYAGASEGHRQQLSPRILDMERRCEQMDEEKQLMEIKVRNIEKNYRPK